MENKKKMTEKIISKIQLQNFATGSSRKDMFFDFSRINKKYFDSIISAIRKYGIKHLTTLGFSLDLYYEAFKSEFPSLRPTEGKQARKVVRSAKPHVEPSILIESAFRKIPNSVDLLIDLLEYVLIHTTSLKSLTFRSYQLKKPQLERLSHAIENNTTLSSLTFDNVTLFDEGFFIMSRALHRPGFVDIHFRNCGLTDMSIDPLKHILSYNVSLQREEEWKASLEIGGVVDIICLKTLDIQFNLFSVRMLIEITDILADLPLTLLDIRNNQPIDDRIVMNIRKTVPHVAIKVNSGTRKKKINKAKKPQKKVVKKEEEYSEEPRTKDYFMPRFNFAKSPSDESISSKSEEIMLTKGVTVVGKRANEFSQYVQELCNFTEEILRAKRPTRRNKRRARSVARRPRR